MRDDVVLEVEVTNPKTELRQEAAGECKSERKVGINGDGGRQENSLRTVR